jgi:hypothetical protein
MKIRQRKTTAVLLLSLPFALFPSFRAAAADPNHFSRSKLRSCSSSSSAVTEEKKKKKKEQQQQLAIYLASKIDI